MRHVEDTLADIRRRFERGAEQFPYLKVAVTSLGLTYAWTLAEHLFNGDGVSGWSSTRGRKWAQFYFDERASSHWRSRQLELLLVDSPAEPNLGEGIATFHRLAADAMHVARSLPGCPIDSSDECGWLELLFTTAWTHPAGSTLRASLQYPLVEMVRALAKCEDVKLNRDNQGRFLTEAESILSDGDFISFLSPFRDSVAMIDLLAAGHLAGCDVDRVAGQQANATSRSQQKQGPPRPFTGGEMVFYEDRAELCGVDICSGKQSESRRAVLELLSQQKPDGTFCAFSGDELHEELEKWELGRSVWGLIRGLRHAITGSLRDHGGLECGDDDVILSGGAGYRLSQCLSVRYEGPPQFVDIGDNGVEDDVPNVPNRVPNDVLNEDVRDGCDVSEIGPQVRQAWILKKLRNGGTLRVADVKAQFSCSAKTARRDLSTLVDTGEIEHEGETSNRYFRLKDTPPANQ